MAVAVNIKGVFNTSNETKYEKEAPEGNPDLLFLSPGRQNRTYVYLHILTIPPLAFPNRHFD